MTVNNRFYYMVGLSGAGKTTICKQLITSQPSAAAFPSSDRLYGYLKDNGFSGWPVFNALTKDERERVLNKLHETFEADKMASKLTIADGHMWVENQIQGGWWNAMASDHKGISDGIIYLNTASEQISRQVQLDNEKGVRHRPMKSLGELQSEAEREFSAAEDNCILNGIAFGVLKNKGKLGFHSFDEVKFLSEYYLPQSSELRQAYHRQFDSSLSPSQLRLQHQFIGSELYSSFNQVVKMASSEWQVLSVPRSANMLALGFTSTFDGPLLFAERLESEVAKFDINKDLVIIDSVVHSGATIERVLQKLPPDYKGVVHVVCLAINIEAIDLIESLSSRVTFHCLGFSNKEERPVGNRDMGARLFGTEG